MAALGPYRVEAGSLYHNITCKYLYSLVKRVFSAYLLMLALNARSASSPCSALYRRADKTGRVPHTGL